MSNIVDFPSDEGRLEKAGNWLMLLEERSLSASEQADFKLWLDSSRQNIAAFEEVARVWGKMEILAGMAELFPLESEQPTAHQPASLSATSTEQRWPGTTAAVFVVAIVSIFAFNQSGLFGAVTTDKRTYITEIGETETIGLEDGSVITANTDSELSVAVNSDERRIELDRGEAFFEVEHDPDRPFRVYAGNGYVRAIGTAFSVYKDGNKVEVIVTEGSVEIVSAKADTPFINNSNPLLLESG